MPPERLRAAGLSTAKTAALRDLATRCLDGTVPSMSLVRRMADEEIIERLTQVRGVGRWTVEMLLMFRLGRGDVLPVADLGMRKGFALTFGNRRLPAAVTVAPARRALASLPFGRVLVSLARVDMCAEGTMMSEKQQGSSSPEPSLQTVEMVCDRLAELGVAVGPDQARALVREVLAAEAPRVDARLRDALYTALQTIRVAAQSGMGMLATTASDPREAPPANNGTSPAARRIQQQPPAAPSCPEGGAAAAGAEAGAAAVRGRGVPVIAGRRGRAPSGVPATRSALGAPAPRVGPRARPGELSARVYQAREAIGDRRQPRRRSVPRPRRLARSPHRPRHRNPHPRRLRLRQPASWRRDRGRSSTCRTRAARDWS